MKYGKKDTLDSSRCEPRKRAPVVGHSSVGFGIIQICEGFFVGDGIEGAGRWETGSRSFQEA